MKLGRILGVVLSVFIALALIDTNLDSSNQNDVDLVHSLISDSARNVETINNDNMSLSQDNNKNVEVSEFKNNYKYSIKVNTNNVVIKCNGSSVNDIELVEKNMKINALFSKKDNKLVDNIEVKSGETIKIHVTNEYVGDEYPMEDVVCNYTLNLNTI